MSVWIIRLCALSSLLALAGCYQVQVKGPVADATISIAPLVGDEALVSTSSWDVAFLVDSFGADTWNSFDDFARLVFVGVFTVDKSLFSDERYYLLTASGGEDLDVNQDRVTDPVGSPVQSEWHAIAAGAELKKLGLQVSALTEVVYQYLLPALPNLSDVDLSLQLDLLAQRLVADTNLDGEVTYRDLLEWSHLYDDHLLLVDSLLLVAFEDALLNGTESSELRQMAVGIVESGAPRTGEMVYRFTQPSGNSFTCATCHAVVEPSRNGFRRPGHPLGSATRRATYKDGQLISMLEAANSCLHEWMNADTWSESSPDWLVLQAWLEERAAPGEAPAVDLQITAPPEDLSGGDPAAGRATFNESCAICHAVDGVGSIQAPPVVGFGLDAELVARRVRLSGRPDSEVYTGLTGGVMPFWGANRLNDEDLLDIVAYLGEGEDANDGHAGGDGGGDSSCGNDHSRVGQSTALTTRAHGVSGIATIVDNCTIELTQFNYDGRGIVVQAYTGVDGDFFGTGGAYPISPDLVGPSYHNATLSFSLPDSISLDEFNSISIWCVEVGVSFGDGIFQ